MTLFRQLYGIEEENELLHKILAAYRQGKLGKEKYWRDLYLKEMFKQGRYKRGRFKVG